jgi:hypothetical protein
MTTGTPTDVNPPADPGDTTGGGTGTDGHPEGNSTPTTTPKAGTNGTDGHPEGNSPQV